jgi:hypothetical protein
MLFPLKSFLMDYRFDGIKVRQAWRVLALAAG